VSIVVEGTLILVLAGVVAIVIALGVRLVKGSKEREVQGEEGRIIQEIHQGMLHLEKRIETLETILLDRSREGRKE
jgi:phage shock protein B